MLRLPLVLFLLSVACTEVRPPAPPPPAPATAPALVLAPAYRLSIHLDPATAGLLGKKLGATLLLLGSAGEHPGATLLGLAELGGVPGADKLALLPGPLRSKLAGWLDEELRRPLGDGKLPLERVAGVVDGLLGVLRVVVVETDLDVAGGKGAHRLGRVGFSLGERRAVVPVPAVLAGVITHGEPSVAFDAAAGSVRLGPERFAVPLGDMALDAAGELLLEPAGVSGLGGLLAQALGCPELARALAARCLLGLCVGKVVGEAELTGMCQAGAELVARRLEAEIRKGQLVVLDLPEGQAKVGADGALEGSFTVAVTVDDQTATGAAPFTGEVRR